MAISLHLDENVHPALADALRRRGVDVTTPVDSGLVGGSDKQHLDFARRQGRVVVTHDADFLRPHAQGVEHAGIPFCHVKNYGVRQLVRVLSRFAMSTTPEGVVHRIEYP